MGIYNWSPVHCRFHVRHRRLDTHELRCTFGHNGASVVGYHHHGSLLPPRFSLIRPNISTNKRAPSTWCSSRHTLSHTLRWGSVFLPALHMCAPRAFLFPCVFSSFSFLPSRLRFWCCICVSRRSIFPWQSVSCVTFLDLIGPEV